MAVGVKTEKEIHESSTGERVGACLMLVWDYVSMVI